MRRHTSKAQPVTIARQAAEAAKSAAQNVDVADLKDTLTAQAARAAEAAQNVDLSSVRDTVATEVAKDYDVVISETRKRPLRSLLIAIGLGAVIGAGMDRMKTRKARQQEAQERERQSR